MVGRRGRTGRTGWEMLVGETTEGGGTRGREGEEGEQEDGEGRRERNREEGRGRLAQAILAQGHFNSKSM